MNIGDYFRGVINGRQRLKRTNKFASKNFRADRLVFPGATGFGGSNGVSITSMENGPISNGGIKPKPTNKHDRYWTVSATENPFAGASARRDFTGFNFGVR